MMQLTVGQGIWHRLNPGWGPRRVLSVEGDNKVTVLFIDSGERKTMRTDLGMLNLIPADDPDMARVATATFVESPKAKATKSRTTKSAPPGSFSAAVSLFLERFPGGFHGEKLLDHERNYKERASDRALVLLDGAALAPLLEEGNFIAFLESLMSCIRFEVRTGQIVSWRELDGLKNVIRNPEAQEPLARAAFNLLHGDAPVSARFTAWCDALDRFDIAKWPIATMPLFLCHRDTHLVIKPNVVKAAAEACDWPLPYDPNPNWSSYDSALGLARKLMNELSGLNPRDMIDIHSFMWGIRPLTLTGKSG
jgi:hypothetical protein